MPGEFSYRYLLVGAGMSADSAARGIRELDPDGSIGIVGAEPDPPATRPALSKYLWTDPDFTFDKVWLGTAEDTGATLHLGSAAVSLDTGGRTVRTESGEVFRYERLLLATGGTPRRLDFPDDERVIFFRTVEDYRRLRRSSGAGRRVAVIGGGFIGTEIAAALTQNETAVTLVFPEETLGGAVFPVSLARHVEEGFRRRGVELIPGSRVERGFATGDDLLIEVPSGDVVTADAVVIGLGTEPNVGLAASAGLSVDDGVLVDETLRTSDPSVWAAGDIARYPDAILGPSRIEHVDNATEMGRTAGRNLAGAGEPYRHTPLFYSDIFENGYEAVGRLDSGLRTIEDWREDSGPRRSGVVYYWDDEPGSLAGVLLWNMDGGADRARELIARPPEEPQSLRGLIG